MPDPSRPGPGPASGDGRGEVRADGIEETARQLGHYRWIEMRLFEVLGGWATDVPETDVKLLLAEQAHHHAWHAELFGDRLPGLPDRTVDDLTVAPTAELAGFVEALERPDSTLERLVGVFRVLVPHKIAAYSAHLERSSSVADAPVVRALELSRRDEVEDWQEGERLIQGLLDSAGAVRRAADHQAELETALVAAGGIAGPGTLDGRGRSGR